MSRENHQPWTDTPERPDRMPEEWQAVCGRTVTFVLDFGQHGGDAESTRAVVRAAYEAYVPAVFVLADGEHEQDALQAVREVKRKSSNTMLEVLAYDPKAAIPLTRDAADFEVCELPYGLIATMYQVALSVSDNFDSVAALGAAQGALTSHHLYEVCVDLQAHPGTEIVASWIQQLRRPPYLFSRDFLEELEFTSLTNRRPDGTRAVPRLALRDHLFGEEKLAAAKPVPAPAHVTGYLQKCTLSALEAVRLAKAARGSAGSNVGGLEAASLGSADALLVKAAADALATADGLDAAELEELAWADAFGARNKADFPLLNDEAHGGKLVYLDSAATTQRAEPALRVQREFDEHANANVYRGAYELSANSTATFDAARKRLENFIGADHQSVAFTMNTTGAMNLVAQAWGEHNIGEGDVIVCELADHHSSTLPFAMLAERKGATVKYVPFDSEGRLDRDAYAEALAMGPKLVCLTHIGNMFGIVAPIAELAAAAHDAGARVVVDAAQSFAHVPLNVNELGADWVALSAHKAYGPMGLGALWISDAAFDEMDPIAGGGGVVSHVSSESYYLRPTALQYEPGTPPVSQAIGFAAAIDYLDDLGMENVARHSAALTRYAARGLQRIEGVNVMGDHSQPDGQAGLVSFTVRSVVPGATARFLGALGVAIRSGGHCALPLHAVLGMIGTGRISIGVHTTRDDIDAALSAISVCRQAYEA